MLILPVPGAASRRISRSPFRFQVIGSMPNLASKAGGSKASWDNLKTVAQTNLGLDEQVFLLYNIIVQIR